MSLSAESKKTIQSTLDSCTSQSSKNGVPGLVFLAVDKKGDVLTSNASGSHGLNTKTPMTEDSVFWIASCTKLITAIACMQLAEQGKLDLDSSKQLYELCPELKDKKVLDAQSGKLVDRKSDMTTRMLLSHTAGFGYSFFNEPLRDFGRPTGFDEFCGDSRDYLLQPLVNQPGSRWEYGINIDWAGIVVERMSGLKLDDYFKRHIFEPLGIKDISFRPSQHMRENMVSSQQIHKDGTGEEVDHPYRRAIIHADTKTDDMFQSGGAGCFAKPKEYCKILAALLNDGASQTTGNRILSDSTVKSMFENQISEFPDFGRQGISAAKPNWTHPLPDLYPQANNPPQGWGLSFMITIEEGLTGRGRNTAYWAGIINSFWWCDREKGVAGMIAAQALPFGNMDVAGTWIGCEKAVYDGLAERK